MRLNFKYTSQIPFARVNSLVDVANHILMRSVARESYVLDDFQEYAEKLGYKRFDEIEISLLRLSSGDKFRNCLQNIRRRSHLSRTVPLLEASDYDASIVIVGLMRQHASLPIRSLLKTLPFSRRRQQVLSRCECEDWCNEYHIFSAFMKN